MVEPGNMGQFFGFTKDEVRALAEKHGMDFDELEKWYDGYQIGDELSMFNPNSVMEAVYYGHCDNNWWGTNNPTLDEIGVMPNKWVILQFTNTTPLITNLTSTLQLSLNTLNNGKKLNGKIPSRTAIFMADMTEFPSDTEILDNVLNMNIKSLGDTITVEVDNQQLSLRPMEIQNSIVTINKIRTTPFNENITITGKLTTYDGEGIANTQLKIIINNKTYQVTTDEDGTYSYLFRVKEIGTNNITVSFEGTDYYKNSTNKTTFVVSKADCVVSIDEISGVRFNDFVVVSGRFCDANGVKLVNSRVHVTVNGDDFVVRTDDEGFYSYRFRALCVGLNNITVGYPGNLRYNPYYVDYSFNVSKES
jgi:hypothetical protein